MEKVLLLTSEREKAFPNLASRIIHIILSLSSLLSPVRIFTRFPWAQQWNSLLDLLIYAPICWLHARGYFSKADKENS